MIKYKMINLEFGHYPNKTEDFFILSCGSDYRAYEVARKLIQKKISMEKIILINFKERENELESYEKNSYYSYNDIFNDMNYLKIDCSITDPSSLIKSFDLFNKIDSNNVRISLDISCFTKPYIFTLIKYFKDILKIIKLTIYYSEPMTYVFRSGLFNTYHSTFGSLTISEVPGFPGNDTRSCEKILVVLLGFDGELSSFIFDEIAPNEIIAINGFPGYAPKFKDISLINNEKLLINKKSEKSLMFVRANNPFETYNKLCEIKKLYSNSFINLAPLGTKPMALGACLYAITDPSIKIVYP
ncbi:MAG TPA: hypothetical protein VGB37_15725, partial [Candidatus Lokiarchaeia archaeon]